jgi:hypothetical protein
VEHERADEGADQRLEIHERARHLGNDARLAPRIQRERQHRPEHHEAGEAPQRGSGRWRRGDAVAGEREWQRRDGARGHLHGRDRHRVATR